MQVNRRAVLSCAVTGAVSVIAAGCTPATADLPPLEHAEATLLISDWERAVRRRDAAALDRTMTGPDAVLLRDRLLAIPFAAEDAGFSVELLELDEEVATIAVSWRLSHEQRTATHEISLPVQQISEPGDPRARWMIDDNAPDQRNESDQQRPVWWLDPRLEVQTAAGAVVIISQPSTRPLTRWSSMANQAHRAAQLAGRAGGLTVIVPSSPQVISQATGASMQGRAAVAWTMGGADGPVHIWLDPVTAAAASDDQLIQLLTHEAVHVLTDSPRVTLPLWVVEGYADAITFADDRQTALGVHQALTATTRQAPPPMLPADDAFDAGPDQALAYATAWSVCQWIVDLQGISGLRRWYDLQDPRDATPPLSELDAWRRVIGTDPSRRESTWRIWLKQTLS